MAFDRSKIFTTRGEWIFDSLSLDGSVTPALETTLGFTDTGAEIGFGDFSFLDSNEESGRGPGVAFFAGQDIRIKTVVRQWDEKILAARFPNQFEAGVDGRIQIPGTLLPGDDLLQFSGRLLLRPSDPAKDPYFFCAKAVLVGSEDVEIRTLGIRKTAFEFQLYPDETLVGQAQELYRTLGVGTANDITHP